MASAQEENQISARYFVQVRHAEILGYIKLQLNPCNRNAISSSCTISLHVYVYAIILIHVRIPARKHYCPPPPPPTARTQSIARVCPWIDDVNVGVIGDAKFLFVKKLWTHIEFRSCLYHAKNNVRDKVRERTLTAHRNVWTTWDCIQEPVCGRSVICFLNVSILFPRVLKGMRWMVYIWCNGITQEKIYLNTDTILAKILTKNWVEFSWLARMWNSPVSDSCAGAFSMQLTNCS